MGAREKMVSVLGIPGDLGLEIADEILDDHARELAEKIRRQYPLRYTDSGAVSLTALVADLIDPDKEA